MRLSGFEWSPVVRRSTGRVMEGNSYVSTPLPWRLVVHTTEGDTIEGAMASYRANGTPPQLTVDPARRRRAQHLDLTRAAYALANLSGGVETNRIPCVQIEVVGYAGRAHLMPADQLLWLGTEVFRPVFERLPIQPVHPKFVGTESGTIATTSARQRFSYDAWYKFNGVCGHQHVPENHHWDPGRLDVDTILRSVFTGPTNPQEGDMKLKQYKVLGTYVLDGTTYNDSTIWIVGEYRRPADETKDLRELIATGQLDPTTYTVSLSTLEDFPRLPGSL